MQKLMKQNVYEVARVFFIDYFEGPKILCLLCENTFLKPSPPILDDAKYDRRFVLEILNPPPSLIRLNCRVRFLCTTRKELREKKMSCLLLSSKTYKIVCCKWTPFFLFSSTHNTTLCQVEWKTDGRQKQKTATRFFFLLYANAGKKAFQMTFWHSGWKSSKSSHLVEKRATKFWNFPPFFVLIQQLNFAKTRPIQQLTFTKTRPALNLFWNETFFGFAHTVLLFLLPIPSWLLKNEWACEQTSFFSVVIMCINDIIPPYILLLLLREH